MVTKFNTRFDPPKICGGLRAPLSILVIPLKTTIQNAIIYSLDIEPSSIIFVTTFVGSHCF
jgi:hypothetical protein